MAVCVAAPTRLSAAPPVIVDDDLLDARVLIIQSVDSSLQHAVILHSSSSAMIHLKLWPLFTPGYVHRHNLKHSQVLDVAQIRPPKI